MAVNYNDGKWHGWNGGECPVHPETVVEYVWFDPDSEKLCGVTKDRTAGDRVAWEQVVKFRVIKEHREPREFWIRPLKDDIRDVVPAPWHISEFIHVREVLE